MANHLSSSPVYFSHFVEECANSLSSQMSNAEHHAGWKETSLNVHRIPLLLRCCFRTRWIQTSLIAWLVISQVNLFAQQNTAEATTLRLDSVSGLELVNTRAEVVMYKGRRSVRLIAVPDHQGSDDQMLAIVPGVDFRNGSIEVDLAGSPATDTPSDSRGFIGLAFRTQEHGSRFENFYLRPTNGRANDQLRRNHTLQYAAMPNFPWFRLRKESPGVYESYADLEAGEWTKMKIVVSGSKAQLYINGGDQPSLVVSDLKLGEVHGQIALWAHWTTDAYFSNLTVRNAR